ncbi:MAG TPA: dTMP kinase, partial [Rhodoferax sp.]
ARGDVVLCDRFTDATFAYQGGGRAFELKTLSFLERTVQSVQGVEPDFIRNPDLTVWFDLAAEIAAQRLAGARSPDKFEAEPVEFFRRVSDGYRQRMMACPKRFARIEAHQTREAVWQDVLHAVQAKGWLA